MSAFDDARRLEDEWQPFIVEFLRGRGCDVVQANRLGNARRLQVDYHLPDLFVEKNNHRLGVEVKVVAKSYSALFLEHWSNKGKRKGWMHTLDADILLYYMVATDALHQMDFHALQTWFPDNQERFPECEQRRFDQPNATWGRLVPWEVLCDEVVGCRLHHGVKLLRRAA